MRFKKKILEKVFSKEFRSLKIISGYLSTKRKKQFSFIFLLMLISAFAEALSLASAVPFLSILSDESIVKNNSIAQLLMFYSGVKGGKDLFFLIGIFFVDFVFEKNQLYFLVDLLQFYFLSNLIQKKLL